ncbi:MAG TPA: TIGR00730 family Rossman fold protein [Acidobacteriaceae bacterium]|jgi:uncharacterized protein (TIGR00730 family)|nr:TIGR00730 family Rossman fold protein [Acidobacteriaceae bacterium]
MPLSSVCVFCASSDVKDARLLAAARDLGAELAANGIATIYGGAHVGLMGALADSALAAGGEVFGVIPRALVDREIAHRGLTRLEIVDSMHERKARMAALSDAFVALPGGLGTMDEFIEIVTWAQLGIHAKPCYLVNLDGYYDNLLAFFRDAVVRGLVKQQNVDRIRVLTSIDDLLQALLLA